MLAKHRFAGPPPLDPPRPSSYLRHPPPSRSPSVVPAQRNPVGHCGLALPLISETTHEGHTIQMRYETMPHEFNSVLLIDRYL